MTQLGEGNCIVSAFHCLCRRKGQGSITILNENCFLNIYIILREKHLATVSAQETKAKRKKKIGLNRM